MQKKQYFGNSCGAASLLCAAGELGIRRLPVIGASLCQGQSLNADNACESALYHLTSGASTGPSPIGNNLEKAGYSMPHNLVLAARLLGLDSEIYMPHGYLTRLLSLLYPRCEQLCLHSGIAIRRTVPPPLSDNQRLLKIMTVMKVAGLHYVMLRPNGQYMDPADGMNFPGFAAMNASAWTKGYADTGISILLSRKHPFGQGRPSSSTQTSRGVRPAHLGTGVASW